MSESFIQLLGVGLAALAFLAVLYLLPTVARLVRKAEPAAAPEEEAGAPPPDLIAVIAAAVAAASGLGVNEFRVVAVNRIDGTGSFNTPIWGHLDRLTQGSGIR